MEKENRRKLSLGDIIRKMNEPSGVKDTGPVPKTPRQPLPEETSPDDSSFTDASHPERKSFISETALDESLYAQKPSQENADPEKPPQQPSTLSPQHYSPPAPYQPETSPVITRPDPQPAAFTHDDEEDEFDIFRYIGVILRRKEIVIFSTIFFGLYSLYSYLTSTKYYIASARLLFAPYQPNILDNTRAIRFNVDLDKSFNTHLELLRSNIVLDRVVKNLRNVTKPGIIASGLQIKRNMTGTEQQTNIIELSLKNPDPELARDALNELCRTYIEYNREVNAQEDTRLLFTIKNQIDKVQTELSSKEDKLRAFKENNSMVELSKDANLVISKLSTMELALQQTQLDLLESRDKIETLKSQINKQEVNVVQSMTYENPIMSKLSELELELNTLSADYNPDHYKIKQINQQIEKLKQAMHNEVEKELSNRAIQQTLIKNPIRENFLQAFANLTVDISALESKRIAQEQIIEKLNAEMKKLPSMEQEYATLQRETDASEKTLKMLKMKLEEIKIQRDSKECELKVFELAQLPNIAVRSEKIASIFIGLLIGFFIGIALIFIIDYIDQSIKEPEDIEKNLEIPLIGIIPFIETENAIVNNTNLTKSILEPFRSLRANIKHITTQHHAKAFMICSAVKGEGKTTLATNLAITFAMDGKKVILMDCDLRRSHIHSLLNIPKTKGLSEYLIDDTIKDSGEIIKPTVHENLFVITSGERPTNPAELLGLPRFNLLINELKSKADFIICDSPALIPVSDSMTMLPHMDCYFMVIRARWTPIKAAKQAKNQLKRINQNLTGAILNGISPQKGYYPYYYGYYGYYRYYSYRYAYEYDEEAKKPFSIRELGLKFDTAIKENVQNARILFPRYLSLTSSFLQNLGKKKLFWFLLISIIAVLVTRKLFEPNTAPVQNQLITYLGTQKNPNFQQPITIINPESNNQKSSSSDSGVSNKNNNPDDGNPQHTKTYAKPAVPAFNDSILFWSKAFNTADTSRLFRFYDTDSFFFPGGGYAAWKKHLTSNLLKKKDHEIIINIDTITAVSVKNNYYKTTTYAKVLKGKDTVQMINTMMWKSTKKSWYIIREKSTVGK